MTLCDAAWRITLADVGRSRSSSCSTGHRRNVDRGGGCAKLRLFIKDDSAQGEGISRAAGPCPQAPASEYPASYYSPSASARAQVAWWGWSSRSHSANPLMHFLSGVDIRPFSLTGIDAVPPPEGSDRLHRHAARWGRGLGHICPELRFSLRAVCAAPSSRAADRIRSAASP